MLLTVGLIFLFNQTAMAATAVDCTKGETLLTLPAWHRGIPKDTENNCSLILTNGVLFQTAIIKIGLNLVEIILQLVAYVSTGFIIYGGFRYMISAGSPDGMSAGKEIIKNAMIGLGISLAAVGIVQTIAGSIT